MKTLAIATMLLFCISGCNNNTPATVAAPSATSANIIVPSATATEASPPSKPLSAACAKYNEMAEQTLVAAKEIGDLSNTIQSEKESSSAAPPKYDGSFSFTGTYRSGFEDGGVVIEQNGKLFLIEEVSCINGFGGGCSPGTWFNGGYVENTGRTITLNVGRYGTPAEVLKSVDKETYQDDQKSYQDSLVEYQKQHAQDIQQYHSDLSKLSVLKQKLQTTKQQVDKQSVLCLKSVDN